MAETKRLYVQNVDAWEKNLSRKRFSDRKLEVKVIERGIVLPARPAKGEYEGGVCDKDFNFVAGFARTQPPKKTTGFGAWCALQSSYTVDRKELAEFDEDVIFGGLLIGHFGHLMVECLSRLWYVVQHPELKSKVLFVTNSDSCKPWAEVFLKLIGLEKERIVYVDKPIECRSITVPEQSQYSWENFTNEYMLPYQAIKSRVTPSTHKKVYLTRRFFDENRITQKNYGQMCCFNEKYFEDFFASHGFEIFAMEKLSIEEQISLVMGADEIATTLGTLSHWSIFKKPTAKFIKLSRAKDFVLTATGFVMRAANLDNCCIVDVSRDFMYADNTLGTCMLGSNKYWKEFVEDYFGEKINEDDGNSYVDAATDAYVDFWCKKYSAPKDHDKLIDGFKTLCHRIVELETQADQDNCPLLIYQTHVSEKGWGAWEKENLLSNPVDQQRDIQAIKIDFSESFQETRHALYYSRKKGWSEKNSNAQMSVETITRDFTKPFHKIYYAVYYNEKEGWSEEVTNGQMAGTTGKSKAITGIKIRLGKAGAKEFDILYRVHKFDGEWTAWAKNGEEIITGGGIKLNSIQIRLKPKT